MAALQSAKLERVTRHPSWKLLPQRFSRSAPSLLPSAPTTPTVSNVPQQDDRDSAVSPSGSDKVDKSKWGLDPRMFEDSATVSAAN